MPNMASVTIMGHCGRDPEIRQTRNGGNMASVSVAVTSKKGETESTMWFRVTLFGRLADVASQYLHKGDAALFAGRLYMDQYVDKQGNAREALCIDANELKLLGGGKREEGQRSAPARPARQESPPGVEYDPEIPF